MAGAGRVSIYHEWAGWRRSEAMRKLPFQIFEDFFSDIAYYFDLAMSATSSQPGGGALPFNEQGRTKNGRCRRVEDGGRGLSRPSLPRSVGLVSRACYHWLGAFPPGIVRHDCIHPSLNIIYGRLREPKIEGRGQKMALVHRNVMRDSKSWPWPNNASKTSC